MKTQLSVFNSADQYTRADRADLAAYRKQAAYYAAREARYAAARREASKESK